METLSLTSLMYESSSDTWRRRIDGQRSQRRARDGQQEERTRVKCFRATKTNTEVVLVEKLFRHFSLNLLGFEH